MNVFEKPLVLSVLIGRQTLPYLQHYYIFLYKFPFYNVWLYLLFPESC